MTDTIHKSQFAIVPMWVHRRIVATRTRTMAHAVYTELVGQYAGGEKDADGLRVWPEVQQIAKSLGVPKSSVERALAVLIDCGVILRKRTVRRNQYWLPQVDPDEFVETLAEFRTVRSDVLDKVQTVTSDGLQTVTSDGPGTVTSDGLYNPDPNNPDPSNPQTLFPEPASNAPASPPPAADEDFDAFWAVYPKKVAKPDAKKAWRAAMKRKADPAHIIRFAEEQAATWNRHQRDPQFIPYPASWLNRERYLDEIEAPAPVAARGYQAYQNPTNLDVYDEDF